MDNNDNIEKNETVNNMPEMVPVMENVVPTLNPIQTNSSVNIPEMVPINTESVPVINPIPNEVQPVMTSVDTSSVNAVIPTMMPVQNIENSIVNSTSKVNMNPISTSVNLVDGNATNTVGVTSNLPTMNPNPIVSGSGNHVVMENVQPRTILQTDASYSEDNNHNKEVVIENPQKEKMPVTEVEYKPLSKIKVFGVVFLFVLLIGFVLFLPEITTYVQKLLSGEKKVVYEKVTTGKLICTYEATTPDTTINYEMAYSFSNNKLEKLKYVTVSRVDPSEDSGTMDSLVSKCLLLKQEVESVSGVSVRCEDEPSILTVTQNFDFEKLDKAKLSSAYDEAGGIFPEYEFGQDMDIIEKNMNSIEYTCHREK